MLLVKQELLESLATELEKISPGAGEKALFETPKVAAHGDLACTAASGITAIRWAAIMTRRRALVICPASGKAPDSPS